MAYKPLFNQLPTCCKLAVLQTDGDSVNFYRWKFMHLLESWRYDVEIADDARGEPQTSHKALVERQR
jgi:hypothetical protein